MAYTTKTLIENRIGENLVSQLSGGDDDVVNQAITEAGQEIDGYIQAHYSVPLASPTPSMVKGIATDLAIFYLYGYRSQSFDIPEHVQERYRDRERQLEKLNRGILDLGVEPPPAKSGRVVATSEGPDKLATATIGSTPGTLRDY